MDGVQGTRLAAVSPEQLAIEISVTFMKKHDSATIVCALDIAQRSCGGRGR